MPFDETAFYPPNGGTRGNIVTRAADLPRYITQGYVRLGDVGLVVHNNDDADFFTRMAYDGAQTTVGAADTWKEVVNVAGAGFLGNVIAPHGNQADTEIGIQIIADGVVWEWTEDLNPAASQWTLIVGAISPSAGQSAGLFPTADRYADSAGTAQLQSPQVTPVTYLMAAGAPVLGFEQSLVVNVKCSVVAFPNAGNRAAATYVMR